MQALIIVRLLKLNKKNTNAISNIKNQLLPALR